MQRLLAIVLALVILPVAGLAWAGTLTSASARLLADTCERVYLLNGGEVSREQVDPALCGVQPTATATATVEPTHTPHPTPTPVLTPGWHPPGAHDGLNVHEHGDAPPQWVLDSGHAPFTQTRESHVGYKGMIGSMANGTQSYLITHILTTTGARSHGDHDYQLWVRDPTGAVSFWEGVLDFGSPPPLRTSDTGERPIILGQRSPTDGCETWYSRPGGLVMDLGWTICGRYQRFDGTVLGGIGAHRGADWTIPCDRLNQFPGAAATLNNYCVVQFGVRRLQFVVTGHQFPAGGVAPIN